MNPDLTEELIQDAHTQGLFQAVAAGLQMAFVVAVLLLLVVAAKRWLGKGLDGGWHHSVAAVRWCLSVMAVSILSVLGWVWLGSLWLPAFWLNWGGIAGQAIAWLVLVLYGALWVVGVKILRRPRVWSAPVNREVTVPSGAVRVSKREK